MSKQKGAQREIREAVLDEEKKGNVVISWVEGYQYAPIANIIRQPVDGLLYDLNRLPEVVLSYIDDPKWVNDYAVQLVIKALKGQNEYLLKALEEILYYTEVAEDDFNKIGNIRVEAKSALAKVEAD